MEGSYSSLTGIAGQSKFKIMKGVMICLRMDKIKTVFPKIL